MCTLIPQVMQIPAIYTRYSEWHVLILEPCHYHTLSIQNTLMLIFLGHLDCDLMMLSRNLVRCRALNLRSLQLQPLARIRLQPRESLRLSSQSLTRLLSTNNNSTPPPAPPPSSEASEKAAAIKEEKKKDLYENIYTWPNLLTLSRIAATPALGYFIVTHQTVPATILLAYAGISDIVRI